MRINKETLLLFVVKIVLGFLFGYMQLFRVHLNDFKGRVQDQRLPRRVI